MKKFFFSICNFDIPLKLNEKEKQEDDCGGKVIKKSSGIKTMNFQWMCTRKESVLRSTLHSIIHGA